MARKVVGVGSVGTRAWIVLLTGRDDADPLFLQAKEAQESVLERFLGPSEYSEHGERVVRGQRVMQASSDIFLGWHRVEARRTGRERDFYLRQLQDWKGSLDPEIMVARGALLYARVCGETLARAHARSGDRVAIAAYLGKSGNVRGIDRRLRRGVRRPERRRLPGVHRRAIDLGRLEAQLGLYGPSTTRNPEHGAHGGPDAEHGRRERPSCGARG